MSLLHKAAAAAVLGAVALAIAGCEVDAVAYRHRGYDDRPVYVQPAPGPVVYTPAPEPVYAPPPVEQQVLVVQQAPPPPRYEARSRAPGVGFVWIGGYWVASGGHWVWVTGRWDRPPHAGARWVPQEWHHVNGEYRLSIGGWR